MAGPLDKKQFAELVRSHPTASDEEILKLAASHAQGGEAPTPGVEDAVKSGVAQTAKDWANSFIESIAGPVGKALSIPSSALASATDATLKGENPFGVAKAAVRGGADALLGKPASMSSALRNAGAMPNLPAKVEVGGVDAEKLRDLKANLLSDPLNLQDLVLKGAGTAAAAAPAFLGKGASSLKRVPKEVPLFAAEELEKAAETFAKPQTPLATLPQTSLPAAAAGVEKLSNYHSPLPQYIRDQYELGKEGADWYANAMPKIRKMLGPDAERMVDYLAATSPNATVQGNTTFAVKALEQDRANEPFTGYMGQTIDRLNKAKAGEPYGGPKVSAFTKALKGDPNAVVVDRWVARHFGIEKPVNDKQYEEIANDITKHANEMGVEPRQLQAALWLAAKKNWGFRNDSAEPFEELLQEMIDQRKLFNPEGLTKTFDPKEVAKVEPPLFTGSATQKYVSDIQNLTAKNGGSTYNLRNGDLGGKQAYAVSAFPEREVVIPPGGKLGPKELASFIDQNRDLLRDPRVSIGTWVVDKASASDRYPEGSITLGLSATPANLAQARMLAKQLGEEAIFDLQNFKTLPTYGKPGGQVPDIAHRLDSLQDVPDEMVAFEHRSDRPNLEELTPQARVTQKSSEYRRNMNYPGKFQPRAFVTRKGGAVEHQIAELPYTYDSVDNIPSSQLYDFAKDPEGLKQVAREKAASEWGDQSDQAALTMFEKLVAESGYKGFYNPNHPMQEMKDTVVLFNPAKVKLRAPAKLEPVASHPVKKAR